MSDDILKDFFEVKDQVLKQEKIEEQKLSVLEEILEFSKLKNIKEEKNLKENESELVDSLVGMAESIKVSQLTDLKEDIDIENGQSVLSELSDFLTDTKKEIFVRENPILAKATDHLSGQLINDHLKPADDYEINRDNIISNLTTQAKHITEPKGFDGNSITQSSGLRRARMPMGTELKRSLKPSAKISANGTPYIAPPDLNDQEIYVGDILFSSLFMYDHRLLFGTPLFEDIVSVEFDNENTKCIPRFDGRYLANPDNGTPHPGLEDLANSRTVKVIRPEVFISLQSLSSVI